MPMTVQHLLVSRQILPCSSHGTRAWEPKETLVLWDITESTCWTFGCRGWRRGSSYIDISRNRAPCECRRGCGSQRCWQVGFQRTQREAVSQHLPLSFLHVYIPSLGTRGARGDKDQKSTSEGNDPSQVKCYIFLLASASRKPLRCYVSYNGLTNCGP